MVRVVDCYASDLGSIPAQACNFLKILFCLIRPIRRELWKNSKKGQIPISKLLLYPFLGEDPIAE